MRFVGHYFLLRLWTCFLLGINDFLVTDPDYRVMVLLVSSVPLQKTGDLNISSTHFAAAVLDNDLYEHFLPCLAFTVQHVCIQDTPRRDKSAFQQNLHKSQGMKTTSMSQLCSLSHILDRRPAVNSTEFGERMFSWFTERP